MTTVTFDNYPLTQRRLQFIGIWFKHILLARTVDIIKQILTVFKLQGLEYRHLRQQAHAKEYLYNTIVKQLQHS